MLERQISAVRLVVTVTLNAVGLAAVLAAGWLMPQFLSLMLGPLPG